MQRLIDDHALRVKPRLRGVFHEAGFYAALALAPLLVSTADPGWSRTAALLFSISVAACFGASALYHRPTWKPRVRSWLRRLDHAGIFILIAGTYTPVAVIVLSPVWAISVLAIVWSGAAAAIALKLFWVDAPKWVSVGSALCLGWVAVVALPQLLKIGAPGLILLIAGGLLYSGGAVVYARRRPDPVPHILGYHELFHVLTLFAAAAQYAAIAFFVLPRA